MSIVDDWEQMDEDNIIRNIKKELRAIKGFPWNPDYKFKTSLKEIYEDIGEILKEYKML